MERKDMLSDKKSKNNFNKFYTGKNSKGNSVNKKGYQNGTNGATARRGNSK